MATPEDRAAEGPTANEMLESMMVDSIGLDNPMTPAALVIAGAEVTARLDTAKKILSGEIDQIDTIDSKAMYALFLISKEAGEMAY